MHSHTPLLCVCPSLMDFGENPDNRLGWYLFTEDTVVLCVLWCLFGFVIVVLIKQLDVSTHTSQHY